MFVSLITPTGMRPEAFALCEKYMARQTHSKFEWIVVDDGSEPTKCTMGQNHILAPKWEPGINTQRPNMNLALEHVSEASEAILIIEDDDWYDKTYVEVSCYMLQQAVLVGGGMAKYYNLKVPGTKVHNNTTHCALFQTAIRASASRILYQAINSGEYYIDIKLWKMAQEQLIPRIIYLDSGLAIGMKGLPGKAGLGVGHVERDYMFDPAFEKLRNWVGEDAAEYVNIKERLNAKSK